MKSPRLLAAVVLVLLGFACLARAQNQPAEFIQVVTVTVKSEAVSEYEDSVKKIVAAANKVGAPQRVYTQQVVRGGPGFTYKIVLPFSKWSEVDAWTPVPDMLVKAYGEAEAAKILKTWRAAVQHSDSEVFRLLPGLSTRPQSFRFPLAYVFVVRTEVKPELASAYELYLAKLKAAQEQAADAPTVVRRVSAQGLSSTYITSIPFDKNSELDGWSSPGETLRKAYGEAEARHIIESSLRCVSKREIFVNAYRPDLSRPPAGSR